LDIYAGFSVFFAVTADVFTCILYGRQNSAKKSSVWEAIFMKWKSLHIANTPLFILYLGFVSTLGSAVWCFLCQSRIKALYPLSYRAVLSDGISQIALSAALHLLLAAAVWWDDRKRDAERS
jgi:hypothetical protein